MLCGLGEITKYWYLTNNRFFNYVEKKLAEFGKTLNDSNLEEMDALWEEEKTKE